MSNVVSQKSIATWENMLHDVLAVSQFHLGKLKYLVKVNFVQEMFQKLIFTWSFPYITAFFEVFVDRCSIYILDEVCCIKEKALKGRVPICNHIRVCVCVAFTLIKGCECDVLLHLFHFSEKCFLGSCTFFYETAIIPSCPILGGQSLHFTRKVILAQL